MESLSLLPELQALPSVEGVAELAPAEMMQRVRAMDRGNFAMEVSIAVEEGLKTLFKPLNVVSEDLAMSYSRAFSNAASRHTSMFDHYQAALKEGPESARGFMNRLKGHLAESKAVPALEERFPDTVWQFAPHANQPGWDLRGTTLDSQELFAQVKTGGESYDSEVMRTMGEHTDISFAVTTDMFDRLSERAPESSARLIDIGVTDSELVTEVKEGVGTLAQNMNIHVPESLGEALPYVREVILGVKLISSFLSTERELSGEALSDRSRVHGVRALALMSRFGVTAVFGWAGGSMGVSAGGLAGTVVPGVGNATGALAGGLIGAGGGAGAAMLLNRMLQPRIEEVAIRLVGGDADDVFYLMNKQAVDEIGKSLAATQVTLS